MAALERGSTAPFKPNRSRARWSAVFDWVAYVAITILVWGVTAFRRGLWQDDVQALGEAFHRSIRPFGALFSPDPGPLRRLTLVPSAIAWATPFPVETLQALCAAVWLGEGVLAGWIVGLLLPGWRWTRFAVVCLTLTATSDYGTGSMVGLAYHVAALFLLAAIGCALCWLRSGRVATLVASMALLTYSLLTMEVALPAMPFLALLFVWDARGRWKGRGTALLAAWGAIVIPATLVAWSFLHDPKSYAAVAMIPMSRRVLIVRTIALWLENFLPWRWAFARPEWYARPAAVIPVGCMAAGACFAASLFLVRLLMKHGETLDERSRHGILTAGLFVTMALAANAMYAGLSFSEIHYRTQILSRIWASMAVGILAGWARARWPGLRWVAAIVVTAFIFFGTWGGIERQDLFLSTWRQHQRELASIIDAAPALRPGTAMILRGTPPPARYLATQADYLTTHWLRMLYSDARLPTFRLDPQRGASCEPTATGLVCKPEGREISYDHKKREYGYRFDALVVMDYEPMSNTWHLLRSLQGDPLVHGRETEAQHYQPMDRIVMQPWTSRQRRLLLQ